MQETWIQSLVSNSPWKEMAPHSSIFAWGIPWTEEATVRGGHKESDQLSNTITLSVCLMNTLQISSFLF